MGMTMEKLCEIADICQLRLTEKEKASYLKEINEVIACVDKMNEIDCDDEKPMFSVLHQRNVLREDVIEQSLTADQALLNAPAREGDFFKIPKVMGDSDGE